MGLKEYAAKRDFTRTREPKPRAFPKGYGDKPRRAKLSKSTGREFVVQKHAATNTHYDLRLQVGDVMKSWAVPKGPSFDPREKRLAVEVEDHPLEYNKFEGTIPEGQYGAGGVMIWDRGQWSTEGDAAKALAKGELKFRLEGERLKGKWMLVRTKAGKPGGPVHWILFKERDNEASPAVSAETFGTSVATGRTMDEIIAGAPERPPPPKPDKPTAASLAGARAAPMPPRLKPQLAILTDKAPDGDEWFHEVKFDGYRLLIYRKGESIRILSRNGLDWTTKLPDIVAAAKERLRVDAIIDGEAVMLDTRGVSDFQALQNAIHNRRSASIVYFSFDLPWCDGHDLMRSPLEQRRALLLDMIGPHQDGRLRFSDHIVGNGPSAWKRTCDHGLEGIISKRRGSLYTPARTADWLKVKCFNQQEFVVGGFTAPEGTRDEFGAMLLGYYDDAGQFRFAGRVGTGFSAETLKRLGRQLRERIQPRPPFIDPPTGAEARDVSWTKPELVAQVQFREWTDEGVIRHTSFRGLREDRDPRTVGRENPRSGKPPPGRLAGHEIPTLSPLRKPETRTPGRRAGSGAKPKAPAKRTPAAGRAAASRAKASATAEATPYVRLSNPDRVVFPDRGGGYTLTKRQVYEYYLNISSLMLPHITGRALAIVRFPTGEGGQSFFQKHLARGMPEGIRGVRLKDDPEDPEPQLVIDGLQGLLGLVQMNALEIHPWGCRIGKPARPDRLIFDLDPGPDVSWKGVVETANLVRQALAQVKLNAFVKTSGGKGLHVVVPITPEHDWDEAKAFTKAFADTLVRLAPRRLTANMSKDARHGKIYIDYLRNARGATAVGPYSLRARPGAPVALPVAWDELEGLPGAAAFNAISVQRRIAAGAPDPWAGMETRAAPLPRHT